MLGFKFPMGVLFQMQGNQEVLVFTCVLQKKLISLFQSGFHLRDAVQVGSLLLSESLGLLMHIF
jgi:hypothetical protein